MSIMVNTDVLVSAGPIDLNGSWITLWGAVESALGTKLTTLMAVIGTIIVVMALVKWAWDRRRGQGGGGGGGSQAIWGALLVGAILSAPGVIIPVMLQVVDAIANAVYSVWKNAG